MDAADVYLAKPAPEEISAQLLRPINAVVGTLNPDGSIPHNWRSWSSNRLIEMSQEVAGELPPDQWWVPEG